MSHSSFLCVSHNKARIRRFTVDLIFIRLAQKQCPAIISTTSVLTCFRMTAIAAVAKGADFICVFTNSLMNYLAVFTHVTFCLVKPSVIEGCHVVMLYIDFQQMSLNFLGTFNMLCENREIYIPRFLF